MILSCQIVGLLLQAAIGFIMGAMYSSLTNHISTFAVLVKLVLVVASVCLQKKVDLQLLTGNSLLLQLLLEKLELLLEYWVFGVQTLQRVTLLHSGSVVALPFSVQL
ncbi:hypothetical protein EDC04DRAFT_2603611 [Pisolithus marmoratus]|nr:hypothetical protein EDC04DRAFT_2603611 [Pisolithus marmoratus]